MREPALLQAQRPDAISLLNRLAGHWAAQAICTAVTLGLFEELAAAPLHYEELARRAGVHAPSLLRLLRALESTGVVGEDGFESWQVTNDAGSLAALIRFFASREHYRAWSALDYSVRTGGSAFEHVHEMALSDALAGHPALRDDFEAGMATLGQVLYGEIPQAYDFSPHRHLIEVCGRFGSFARRLVRAFPLLRASVTKDPYDIAAGADAYLLVGLLHEHEDAGAITVLRTVRRCIGRDGVLLIGEHVIENAHPLAALLDLEMLVTSSIARERTHAELDLMLHNGGFKLRERRDLSSGASLLIADSS